jgi:hypothetical protein
VEPGDEVGVCCQARSADGPTDGTIDSGDPYVISEWARGRTSRQLLRGSLPALAFGVAVTVAGAVVVGLGL